MPPGRAYGAVASSWLQDHLRMVRRAGLGSGLGGWGRDRLSGRGDGEEWWSGLGGRGVPVVHVDQVAQVDAVADPGLAQKGAKAQDEVRRG